MTRDDYCYVLHLTRSDGRTVGRIPVDVDWEPACECALFGAMRRGEAHLEQYSADRCVEPLWSPAQGEPHIGGFRVRVATNGSRGEITEDFPLDYFRGLAQGAATRFVQSGELNKGELFYFGVDAFLRDAHEDERPSSFAVEPVSCPFITTVSNLRDYAEAALPCGVYSPDVLPVFIPQAVLEECAALAREVGAVETGGILVGHIHQDPSIPELFVEVTAQIPAPHTKAELTRLTFTPDTWSSVQTALDLRRAGEFILGWWHLHPGSMLRQAGEDAQQSQPSDAITGRTTSVFFSDLDVALTRACFSRAFSVALVIGETMRGERAWGMYGWSQGRIGERGFCVLPSSNQIARRQTRCDESIHNPEGNEHVEGK